MFYTKKELEDIWNNKPVGFLKGLSKGKRKKPKIFDVQMRPIFRVKFPQHRFNIPAQNINEAYEIAKKKIMELPGYEGLNFDSWEMWGYLLNPRKSLNRRE